ncbi:PREDICTED: putative F-box protein At1g67390 [Tarenaya hassleriana]|uniref:putative F-box protein At1g67390 n=1 Tax=Tarenaya hassleriana TaxID=28532 RepID=UPI00053C2C78|nr:PREDICTED: putative F-box protein At1g67390 [Tarenaya hassleriana]
MEDSLSNHQNQTRACECDGVGNDFISKLPDELLGTILERLSTEEAMRTCVLSKRWENVWRQNPDLVFDMRRFMNVPRQLAVLAGNHASLLMIEVLRNFHGSMESCRIHHFLQHVREGNVIDWVRYLVHDKDIKDLALICETGSWDYPKSKYDYYRSVAINFPREIFAGRSLHSLELNRFCIPTEFGFWNCYNLLTLKLVRVFVESNDINRILLFCPYLKELVLRFVFNMNVDLKIYNDSLKFLELSGLAVPMIEVDAPDLDVLVLDDLSCRKEHFTINAPKLAFHRSYWSRNEGYLGYNISGSVKDRIEANESIECEILMGNTGLLRHLGVMSVNVNVKNPRDMEILSKLLRECGRLAMLEICLKRRAPEDEERCLMEGQKPWKETKPFPCMDKKMESVWIYDFDGSEEAFAFASRFVMEGNVMKNMAIHIADAESDETAVALDKLSRLPKASNDLIFITSTSI